MLDEPRKLIKFMSNLSDTDCGRNKLYVHEQWQIMTFRYGYGEPVVLRKVSDNSVSFIFLYCTVIISERFMQLQRVIRLQKINWRICQDFRDKV